jgi:uncharacterized tellurite resistance protein B-like protein
LTRFITNAYKKQSQKNRKKETTQIKKASKMKDDYENKKTNLDNIIRIIDMVYKNNTAKRLYLLRLCFYCAYADNHLGADEHERILEVAKKLGIYKSEIKRIHQEVVNELGI